VDPLADLRAAIDRGEHFDYRFFWGHTARADGALGDSCFSQWWPCRFELDGMVYSSAEQFMMSEKARIFGDDATRAKILATQDPRAVKKLGREVVGFDHDHWAKLRVGCVTAGNVAKFGQDERLGAYLIATGVDVLVEASPVDLVWGIGWAADAPEARDPHAWRGLNLLGFALGEARARLR
jgi:ribA/ribD-fused uncharacterized protein